MGRCALLGMCYNEVDFFKMWYDYYSRHFDACDIYIIDDESSMNLYEGIKCNIEVIGKKTPPGEKKHVNDCHIHRIQVDRILALLNRYRYVLHADMDEFIVPDPEKYPDGLKQFIDQFDGEFAQCSGYNILDNGVPFDASIKPWLSQRQYYHRDWAHYCKVTLTSNDPQWGGGFHESRWNRQWNPAIAPHERDDFRLFHFHYTCKEMLRRRYEARNTFDGRFLIENASLSVNNYLNHSRFTKEEIPEKWKRAL